MSLEIVTPVWLPDSLDNCSEFGCCFFLQTLSTGDGLVEVFYGRMGVSLRYLKNHVFKNVCISFL